MKKNNRKTPSVKTKKTAMKTSRKRDVGYFLAPFLIMLISLAVESCLIFNEKTGFVGEFVYKIFTGLFGFAAYFIPAGTLFIAFFFNSICKKDALVFKSVMFSVFSVFLASLGSEIAVGDLGSTPISLTEYFSMGCSGEGGGVIGCLVGRLMLSALGGVFSLIVSLAICILSASFFIGTEKVGIWAYLKEMRMFGAEKTATPKPPKLSKREKRRMLREAAKKEGVTEASVPEVSADVPLTVESVPKTVSRPTLDPFRYGSEVGSGRAKGSAVSIDLRSPAVKRAEIKDIYSEEQVSPSASIDIGIKPPIVRAAPQSSNAYSPFADPLRSMGASRSVGYGAERRSGASESRAYSPFADPLRSREEDMKRSVSEPSARIPEIRNVDSSDFRRSYTSETYGGAPRQTPHIGITGINGADVRDIGVGAASSETLPSVEDIFPAQNVSDGVSETGRSDIGASSNNASDGALAPLDTDIAPESNMRAEPTVEEADAEKTVSEVRMTVSNIVPERKVPDTAEEDIAPWEEPVKPVISREVALNTSKLSDEDYSEDVDDGEDDEERDGDEETAPLGSTREYKGSYAEKYNIEKQNAEQRLDEESDTSGYRDRSEKFYPDYVYPSSVLLEERALQTTVTEEDVLEVRDKLLGKLASFKIEASLVGYSAGPTITRYEIAPGPGVKVKAITNLIEDIGLELQSDGVRIATVPGKSVIGIEVPNKVVSVVSLRSLIENRDFMNARSKITVCVGLTVTGKPVYMDVDEMPHVLIAGQTKSGKSVAINCMLLSLLYRTTPDEVQLILIDPKRVELNIYSKVPHLVMPVIDDPQRAAAALRWAVNEMERRYEMMDNLGVRNRDEYYELKEQDPTLEYMPQIVIVIDELADLMLQVREHVETLINRLAAKARACGIHLLVGTQRPSVDIVTGLIKANIPARISFQVSSSADSRIILGTVGAEKLLGKGDMLYQATGAGRVRVQGAFVSSGEIKRVTKFIIDNNGEADFDPEVMRQLDIETDKINKTNKKSSASAYSGDDDDGGIVDSSDVDVEYICKAMEYIFESRIVTTNAIQRHLRIGFNRAADIVDSLEELGFISPKNGSKQRDILIDYETFEQWKLRNAM